MDGELELSSMLSSEWTFETCHKADTCVSAVENVSSFCGQREVGPVRFQLRAPVDGWASELCLPCETSPVAAQNALVRNKCYSTLFWHLSAALPEMSISVESTFVTPMQNADTLLWSLNLSSGSIDNLQSGVSSPVLLHLERRQRLSATKELHRHVLDGEAILIDLIFDGWVLL